MKRQEVWMFPINLRIAHACEATSSPPAKKKKKVKYTLRLHGALLQMQLGVDWGALWTLSSSWTCLVHAPFKSCSLKFNRSVVSGSVQPQGLQLASLLCQWGSPGKNTGVGCHALLQGSFANQGSNPGPLHLLHWQVGPFPLVTPWEPSKKSREQNRVSFSHTVQSTLEFTLKIDPLSELLNFWE